MRAERPSLPPGNDVDPLKELVFYSGPTQGTGNSRWFGGQTPPPSSSTLESDSRLNRRILLGTRFQTVGRECVLSVIARFQQFSLPLRKVYEVPEKRRGHLGVLTISRIDLSCVQTVNSASFIHGARSLRFSERRALLRCGEQNRSRSFSLSCCLECAATPWGR